MALLLNRRRFVVSAAAGLSAPLLVRAEGLARGVSGIRPGPNGRLTLGFVGVGLQNRYHLDRFLKREGCRVLAVCEVDTTRREHAKKVVDEKYAEGGGAAASPGAGGCAAYVDHRELLARKDIDAVVIASPDHWHAIHVIDAARAGKDIYCEKPLCLTIHEAKAMIDAVRTHGRVFQTGSQQRTEYDGRFRTACEYVRSGRLGALMAVHVGVGESSTWCDLPEEPAEPGLDWDRWLGPAPVRPYNTILSPRGIHNHYPRWRLYREYSGGIITDWGAHHFDIAQWGLDADTSGPVGVAPPPDPAGMYGAKLVYSSGVEVFHGGPGGVTFVGARGSIFVDRGRLESNPADILKKPLEESDTHLPKAADHHTNWLDCIKSRARPICDVEIGARSITLAHLCNLAYWHRRPFTWDPSRWEFPGDAEANGFRDYTRRTGFELPSA